MTTVATPVVAWHATSDADAPLVVLLHGRGSNETDILSLADHLHAGVAYAAVQAPIAGGGGYAWFANRGMDHLVAELLQTSVARSGEKPLTDAPRAPRRRRNGQETADFTSSTTFFSTAGLHLRSAYDTGHRSPSSRLAASWKPRVEYR